VAPKAVPRVDLQHVASAKLSVTEAVAELADELPRMGPVTFQALTDSFVERLEVVIRFLAVLELYKQGLVDLDQPATFGELTITWVGGDLDDEDGSVLAGIAAGVDRYDG
jgi:segregation and condensation protein A